MITAEQVEVRASKAVGDYDRAQATLEAQVCIAAALERIANSLEQLASAVQPSMVANGQICEPFVRTEEAWYYPK